MTCAYCGTELPEGAMFCGECGRAVAGKSAKSASTAKASMETSVRSSAKPVEAPVALAEPVPEPEVVVEPEPAAAEIVAEPEPQPDLEPQAVAEIVAEPEPRRKAVARESKAAGVEEPEPARVETCVQCGAELGASDIFCPECGFVRQSVAARSRPNDTAVLDPFPWGLPRSTESSATAAAPTFADEANGDIDRQIEPDVDETRLVDHTPRGDRFVLQFSTGESVSVSGTGLVGRNPVAEPGEYFDSLVTILDPGKSVSKTHLEFGQDAGSFWISDRFSGNGTVLREPERDPRRCDAGKRYRVSRGARVDIGEQFFIVS